MILLEYFPCKTKQELRARERYFYETLMPTLNSISPILDVEKAKAYSKEYKINNKEKIQAEDKLYREAHKEERKVYEDGRKDIKKIKDREYAQTHKAERKKQEDTRRDDINAKQKARRIADPEFNAKRRANYALKKNKEINNEEV
jgi:hypothetical protein